MPACDRTPHFLLSIFLIVVGFRLINPTFPFSQELMKAVMSKDNETMQKYMADAEILQLMARFQKLSQEAGLDPSMFPPPPGME